MTHEKLPMNKPTSIYLDLVRFLAAVTVFLVHANYERFTGGLPFLWRFGNLGNDAVMVFFVLSGFVIAYVYDQKERTPKDYFASRFSRLYSVAIPALILTLILDYFGSRLNPSLYSGTWFESDAPGWRLLANLFFVNELWFSSIRPFSNGPFWSLGYEFWYYVIFAVVVFCNGPQRYLLIGIICLFIGPKILLLFPVWIFGVLAYKVVKSKLVKPTIAWILTITPILCYIGFRQRGYPEVLLDLTLDVFGTTFVNEQLKWSRYFLSSYIIGLLIAAHFIGVSFVSPQLSKWFVPLQRPIRYLAGFTFAIYLFHYPSLQFFAAVAAPVSDPLLKMLFVICGTISVIFILGTFTENRKDKLRRWLLRATDTISSKFSHGIK